MLRLALIVLTAAIAATAAPAAAASVLAAGTATHTTDAGGSTCSAPGAFTVTVSGADAAILGASDCLFTPDAFSNCATDQDGKITCSRAADGETASLALTAAGSLVYSYATGAVTETVTGTLARFDA